MTKIVKSLQKIAGAEQILYASMSKRFDRWDGMLMKMNEMSKKYQLFNGVIRTAMAVSNVFGLWGERNRLAQE